MISMKYTLLPGKPPVSLEAAPQGASTADDSRIANVQSGRGQCHTLNARGEKGMVWVLRAEIPQWNAAKVPCRRSDIPIGRWRPFEAT
jgi:hypothetical protein